MQTIGDKYRLKRAMLGNEVGTEGYVFNIYPAFDNAPGFGIQIIFPNGQYDGFSPEEQNAYLEFVEHYPRYSLYKFKSVMWLSQSYRGGYWSF